MKGTEQQADEAVVVQSTTVGNLLALLESKDETIALERRLRKDLLWIMFVLLVIFGVATAWTTWTVARLKGVVTVQRVAPVCTCPCPGGSLRRDGDMLSCTCPVPP